MNTNFLFKDIKGTSKYSFAAILHCLLPHLFGSNAQQNSILLALFAFKLRQNPTQSCVPLVFRGALSINNFYKAFAYLYLYKSFENIDITDMTLTFSVSHYPREVIKHLQNVRKLNVTKKYNGIYYVTGDLIPIQFIINTELDEDENLFLNSLTKSISENKINTLFDEIAKTEKAAEESITAFIDAVVRGNKEKFAEVAKMSDLSSLAEIFEGTKCAEIWETHGIERGREEGRKEGKREDRNEVRNILNNCRDLEEAKKKLMSMG
ncbi:MAG: hypothetical protein Ta2B_18560 [Termitinemataceae bacterium]|nr:MAG: hypothetical protein Ta2B_18560 [Termitinemataceae bacterium]